MDVEAKLDMDLGEQDSLIQNVWWIRFIQYALHPSISLLLEMEKMHLLTKLHFPDFFNNLQPMWSRPI